MRSTLVLLGSLLAVGCASSAPAPASSPAPSVSDAGPRTVQPGAPGQATRVVDADSFDEMGGVNWVEADAEFMQGMIPHHAQALVMTSMVPDRAATPGVVQMALRMEISQRDEMAQMIRWLADRDQTIPASAELTDPAVVRAEVRRIAEDGESAGMDHDAMDHGSMDHGAMGHGGHAGMAMMPGMLTQDELRRLEEAEGAEFDRLFLEYMIRHHEGAIVMVDALFAQDGAGQESEIFQFASHVDADQRAEIARMRMLLDRLEAGAPLAPGAANR